jgi:glyoxylase-like metal-dependent hydrolase (beta-lactamase superfamily II)
MRCALLLVLLLSSAAADDLPPFPLVTDDDLLIHRFETTCNTYFLTCRKTGKFVVIDPGVGTTAALDLHAGRGHSLLAIWITHEHDDHIAGLGELELADHIPVLAHKKAIRNIEKARAGWGEGWSAELKVPAPTVPDSPIDAKTRLQVGRLELSVLHVPGHAAGSLCYRLGDRYLFCGDVLFKGNVGATHFEGCEPELFRKSLSDNLWDLPSRLVVLPGHMEQTTIGAEKKSNWFFQDYVRAARGLEPIPRPWLGIRLDPEFDQPGVRVLEVTPGSPAAKTGLESGDVIRGLGGADIKSPSDLGLALRAHAVGEKVSLKVRRDGKEIDLELNLGARPK